MGDVLDAGTRFPVVEIVVTHDHGAGVTRVQVLEQCAHGCLLCRCAGVVGLTADVQPALVADADGVQIVVLSFDVAVGADHPFRTT